MTPKVRLPSASRTSFPSRYGKSACKPACIKSLPADPETVYGVGYKFDS